MKEYKVMSQKDKWFHSKFDPEALEQGLNAYAAQGWRVISIANAPFTRDEMVVVLERDT